MVEDIKLLELGKYKLRYSSCISCRPQRVVDQVEIYIGSDGAKRPYSTYNMQDDYSDFEAITFCVWSQLPECNITLRFDSIRWNENFPVDYEKCIRDSFVGKMRDDAMNSWIQHYMRFLYRAWKMSSLYEHFFIHEDNKDSVAQFARTYIKAQNEGLLRYTVPNQESGIKKTVESIAENHLEKWFVLNSEKGTLKEYVPEMAEIIIYDQFPCGLFYGRTQKDVSEKNRIFNSGAFDLWGINSKNEICLYELKEKSNTGLGIISELFFYSCICLDIRKIGKGKVRKNYRGFNDFWLGKDNYINAYFLAPRFYDFIEQHFEDVLKAMNSRKDKAVVYNKIVFSQEEIVSNDYDKFKENLISEWEKSRA